MYQMMPMMWMMLMFINWFIMFLIISMFIYFPFFKKKMNVNIVIKYNKWFNSWYF